MRKCGLVLTLEYYVHFAWVGASAWEWAAAYGVELVAAFAVRGAVAMGWCTCCIDWGCIVYC